MKWTMNYVYVRFANARMLALHQLGSHAAGEKKVPIMYYHFFRSPLYHPVNDELMHIVLHLPLEKQPKFKFRSAGEMC
jgi:hypothetical protein